MKSEVWQRRKRSKYSTAAPNVNCETLVWSRPSFIAWLMDSFIAGLLRAQRYRMVCETFIWRRLLYIALLVNLPLRWFDVFAAKDQQTT